MKLHGTISSCNLDNKHVPDVVTGLESYQLVTRPTAQVKSTR